MFPAVTVIIPTYNWATVLPYSIASVLDQGTSVQDAIYPNLRSRIHDRPVHDNGSGAKRATSGNHGRRCHY